MSEQATGTPAAIASSTGIPKPSKVDRSEFQSRSQDRNSEPSIRRFPSEAECRSKPPALQPPSPPAPAFQSPRKLTDRSFSLARRIEIVNRRSGDFPQRRNVGASHRHSSRHRLQHRHSKALES